ncbi:hypothetical protein D9M71_380310 [compost metagenome]
MHRRRLEQQANGLVIEKMPKPRMLTQHFGQQLHEVLGSTDMVTRLVVAGFGQRGHGLDGHILDGHDLGGATLHFLLQVFLLITQKVGSRLDLQLGFHPRQHNRRIDRLGDVVHSAHLQTTDFVLHGRHGGKKDDGNVGGARVQLELFRHLMTRKARHHDVEQN